MKKCKCKTKGCSPSQAGWKLQSLRKMVKKKEKWNTEIKNWKEKEDQRGGRYVPRPAKRKESDYYKP